MTDTRVKAFRAAAVAAVVAVAACVAALFAGGAVAERVVPGLGDAGTATRWGLPLSRLAMDVGAVLTMGGLLAAATLVPSHDGLLHPVAMRYLRGASWFAAFWAGAASSTLVFTVSDILGEPPGQVMRQNELSSYVGQLPQGIALMMVVLVAAVLALLARTTVRAGAALALLAFGFMALLPPPLTGHSATAANHSVAVTSLALHVGAVTLWVGGLLMLGWHALRGWDDLGTAAGRYSRMALWCYVTVGLSGAANTVSRLPDPAELVTTGYGRLVLAKVAAFVVLGCLGYRHRTRTLPAVAARRPGAFARLAALEVAVMAAALGVAVALSRSAPPTSATGSPSGSTSGAPYGSSAVEGVLGYAMPPAITVGRLLTMWRLDLFFAVLVVVLGGLYAAGVRRLRRRGDSWPAGRTAAWFLGLLTIVIATMSGVATYAPVLFSVHMAQHMVLSMLTPILLVLGGPLTLALRALRPVAVRGDRGPREWLAAALHSRVTRLVTHPAVATGIFVASTYLLYFTPMFGAAMRTHLGHIVMLVHFMLSGSLFFWLLVGVDPAPRRLPYVGRLLLLFVTMPFHAFFGIALMNLGEPVAPGWYSAMRHPWGASVLSDQHTGGAIAWAFGEIPTFIVLIAMVFQWAVEDQRLARRLERRADRAAAEREDDELAAYNTYLAALDKRAEQLR